MATQSVKPFDISPGANANSATNADGTPKVTAASPWPSAAGYDPAVGTGQTATSTATGYTPAATPATTNWDVTPDQTVAGQVKKIIDEGSPLQQQAGARADQQSNRRGLLNSSLAVGAGQAALYDAAMPIATADAARYGQAAGYNTDTTNKFNAAGFDAANQAKSFEATAANRESEFNADASNRQLQADQTAINQSSQFGADATNRALLSQLDSTTRVQLADIEANYKSLLQASDSASKLQQQSFLNITEISRSNTLDQAAKDAAVANQISMLKTGLGIIGAIGNLDLGPLLTF